MSDDILRRLVNRFDRYMTRFEETGETRYLAIAMEADRLYRRGRRGVEGQR